MRPATHELLAEFTELSHLSESELNLYLHAFNTRRAGVNLGLGIGSLVLGTLVFVPIAVVGLIIA
ncbi:MAG: hypothetical protein IT436_12880, partial [Phycisphaerales bacterium]|nr:hypothetical protein [Phycisphaerales bacterium]